MADLRIEVTAMKTVRKRIEPELSPSQQDFSRSFECASTSCGFHTLQEPHSSPVDRSIQFTKFPELLELQDSPAHPHHFSLILINQSIEILDS
jgi:hypothetical protein